LQDIKQSVILRPGDQGFKTLSYELGVLTLRLSNIEPYGNGTRVHLQIGNPSAATVDDVSAKVHWGSNDLDPSSMHAATLEFSRQLQAASWTDISLVLEGVGPDKLQFVTLSGITYRRLLLRQ
jgi:Protein of unknown function (DUF3251)